MEYKHVSQIQQILLRPGHHVGSTKNQSKEKWIFSGDSIIKKTVTYNPALLHIFYEVLSNAQDNYFRSLGSKHPLKKIEVTINKETGEITVLNDGLWIPIRIHEWTNDEEKLGEMYEPELIFGHLNSSSNYNDEKTERRGAGLHGVGVKLTNIFSSKFTVECFDPESSQKFVQIYTENMSKRSTPKITSKTGVNGYTKITWIPDFTRFSESTSKYSDTFINLAKKMCYDCAMVTGAKIIFNDEQIPIKTFYDYTTLYNVNPDNYVEFKSKNSSVIVYENNGYEQVSFVNGITTEKGGVHVDTWNSAIFKPLFEKIKKKYTSKKSSNPLKLTLKNLLEHFIIFIKCDLPNPEFDGQTKESLNNPVPEVSVQETKLTKMMSWDFINEIEEIMRLQGLKELKKTDGKKTTTINIENADDANKAGTKESLNCTLFITEGMSAKTFVVKGISAIENGTDYYGILPVRGKVLNVIKANASQINDNKEICNFKKMLGLQHGLDYSKDVNMNTLRYGHIKILCDADNDGNHIKGLIMNFFQYLYPSLLEQGYIESIRTPIVKASIGKKHFSFYFMKDYKDWNKTQTTPPTTCKYYKGLGTSTDEDILEIFNNPRNINYKVDEKAPDTINMVFSNDRILDRKKWLENYTQRDFVYPVEDGVEIVKISDFFNNEMIEFSKADNERSIPNVVDGLKPSQRKAIWVGLKVLNQKDDYKVAQFAGDIAKKAEYHHGEKSMEDTIVGLAQTFLGSNNLTVFAERGQFGSRISGGDDAASSRYIYTRLTNIARFIFRKEDDPVLKYLEEEGTSIEPNFFVPIVPMLLINGSKGIGTGFSTNIPAHNPIDIVKWIMAWIDETEDEIDLVPWYWGFKGTTTKVGTKITYTGVYSETGYVYNITELPIGCWTDNYKQKLEKMRENKILSKIENKGGAFEINFKVVGTKKLDANMLSLVTTSQLTNLTAFTSKGGLKKYISIEEMLTEFCEVRLKYYVRRKKYLIIELKKQLQELESKSLFINEVLASGMKLLKQTEDELFKHFEKNDKYHKKDDSYKYLTDMPIRNFTADKVVQLQKQITEIKNEVEYIEKTEPADMWKKELNEFLVEYEKWKLDIEKSRKKIAETKIKRKK